jgi:hypothetical protein
VLLGTSVFLIFAGLVGVQTAALLPAVVLCHCDWDFWLGPLFGRYWHYRFDRNDLMALAALTLLLPLGIALHRRVELAREAVAELLSFCALLPLLVVPLTVVAAAPRLVTGALMLPDAVALLFLAPVFCIACIPAYPIALAARYFRSPVVRAWFSRSDSPEGEGAAASGPALPAGAAVVMKRLGWTIGAVGLLSSAVVLALRHAYDALLVRTAHSPGDPLRMLGVTGLLLSEDLAPYLALFAMLGGYFFVRARDWARRAALVAVAGYVGILLLLHASGAIVALLSVVPSGSNVSLLPAAVAAAAFLGCALLLWLAASAWSRLRSAAARVWCGEGEGADVACVPPAEPGRGA